MCCTDGARRVGPARASSGTLLIGLAAVGVLLAAGCSRSPAPAQPGPVTAPPPSSSPPGVVGTPLPPPVVVPPAPPASPPVVAVLRLPAPSPVRNWSEVRLQAARRIVAANPQGTYLGPVPEPLLAIPVLEIELNGDGSVRRIEVLRPPRQAKDTIELAAAAVRRAAPFGDVSRLPKPWRFTETFLFADDRRFKPRTLDP